MARYQSDSRPPALPVIPTYTVTGPLEIKGAFVHFKDKDGEHCLSGNLDITRVPTEDVGE